MPIQTLVELATAAAVANVKYITSVGDVPYKLARPILYKIENPLQLRQVEEDSPQILGADAELWLNFIKRDVPNWRSKPHEPEDPAKWYKVYAKLVRDNEKETQAQAELLKAAFSKQDEAKKMNTVNVVNKVERKGKRRIRSVSRPDMPQKKMMPNGLDSRMVDKIRREAQESAALLTRTGAAARSSAPRIGVPRAVVSSQVPSSTTQVRHTSRPAARAPTPEPSKVSFSGPPSPGSTARSGSPMISGPSPLRRPRPAPSIFATKPKKRPRT